MNDDKRSLDDSSPYTETTEPLPDKKSEVDVFEDDPNDPDTKCGLGPFQPDCLQVFARIGAFVGIYSASGLLTSTLAVYVNSQVSMLEKQFGFSSAQSGFIMSCNDIGYLSTAILSGYIARKVHIPRGLGIATALFGVCGILCAIPFFITDRSSYELSAVSSANMTNKASKLVPMCMNNTEIVSDRVRCLENSDEGDDSAAQLYVKRVAYTLISIGMVFQGLGKSPRSPFVTLYIDDSVDKRKTGFYMGILVGTGIFGPALAYLVGGLFSKIYVTLQDVPIGPRDPRWIGAWWLGFIVFGACAIITSVPIMCFPRRIRSRSGRTKKKGEGAKHLQHEHGKPIEKAVVGEVKEFLASMMRLSRNPVYMLIVIATCINLLGVAGSGAFLPKFLSAQYTVPLWQANIIVAISSIAAVSLGSFTGGVITRRVEMKPQITMKMLIVMISINIICLSSGFFLGCNQPEIVGDPGTSGEFRTLLYKPLNISCPKGCECDDEKFFPICGIDGRTYFSPCHAGCTRKTSTEFFNCTCIPGGEATGGLCDQGCTTKLYVFAAFMFVGKFFTALKIMPGFIAKIRCVAEKDRAVATACAGFATSALGWMPGPVIFGLLIDGTCSLWKYTCGERLSCLLYDIVFFRNAIHGFYVVAAAVCLVFYVILYLYFVIRRQDEWRVTNKANDVTLSVQNGVYSKMKEAKNGVV